jgi:hypothetical protein
MRGVVSVACLGVAIGALVTSGIYERRSRREIAQLRASMESLSVAARRSEGDVGGLAGALGRLASTSVVRKAESSPAAAEARSATESAAPKPPAPSFEESQQLVLSAYENERVDGKWSADALNKLQAIARDHLSPSSRLRSLDCRATMCRMEVFHSRAEDETPFLMNGFGGWPGSILVAGESREHDGVAVTLIASREGTQPPIGVP